MKHARGKNRFALPLVLGLSAGGILALGASGARGQATAPPVRPQAPLAQSVVPSPSHERVFLQFENDQELRRQMARERPQGPPPPTEPRPSPEPLGPRQWPPLAELVEPYYVCYGRLNFEQINSERYGWSIGPLQPVLSAGIFYWDVATLPYHLGTEPLRRYECSAGYCLPGDPVPFLLYPPELSATGALSEVAAIGLIAIIFP